MAWDDATVAALRCPVRLVEDDTKGWAHTHREVGITGAEWRHHLIKALEEGYERDEQGRHSTAA